MDRSLTPHVAAHNTDDLLIRLAPDVSGGMVRRYVYPQVSQHRTGREVVVENPELTGADPTLTEHCSPIYESFWRVGFLRPYPAKGAQTSTLTVGVLSPIHENFRLGRGC